MDEEVELFAAPSLNRRGGGVVRGTVAESEALEELDLRRRVPGSMETSSNGARPPVRSSTSAGASPAPWRPAAATSGRRQRRVHAPPDDILLRAFNLSFPSSSSQARVVIYLYSFGSGVF